MFNMVLICIYFIIQMLMQHEFFLLLCKPKQWKLENMKIRGTH
jgi:hypothetical protein